MITINNNEFTMKQLMFWVEGLTDKEVQVLVDKCEIPELWKIAMEELMIRTNQIIVTN